MTADEHTDASATGLLHRARTEIRKVIVGQDHLVERLLITLLARGHCLLEGSPGAAKTLAAATLATVTGGTFARIQFTPDLVPSDIVGTRVYHPSTETFTTELGPVFANLVLADEINRAPAKVQSALLEVMAEHQVTIAGHTHPLPAPFTVLATQNPLESEGVYPLPEAQRDRFLLKVHIPYPGPDHELQILQRMAVTPPAAAPVLGPATLTALQHTADTIDLHPLVADYIVRIVMATRRPADYHLPHLTASIGTGAGPRATLGLTAAARARALLHGRDYVLPDDVADLAPDIVTHRLALTFDAIADGTPARHLLDEILTTVPPPRVLWPA